MTIVYTAILGGSDSLKPAPTGADRCVCFVDDPAQYPDAKGWELVRHEYAGDPRREAWRLRCLPHTLFPVYDRVIWIDASFTLTDLPKLLVDSKRDHISAIRHHSRTTWYQEAKKLTEIGQSDAVHIGRQIAAYLRSDYKADHLSISCVIVRSGHWRVTDFGETWWTQIQTYPGDNTQVSLDYSAWVNELEIAPLRGTRHDNPYSTHDAADHKKRRRPYLKGAAA